MEMGRELLETITSIVTAIIGLAVISVLLSDRAKTTSVISAGAGGLAEDIEAATSPVSGGSSIGMSLGMDSMGIY